MEWDLEVRDGVLRVASRGAASVPAGVRLLDQAVSRARAERTALFLFDIRGVTAGASTADILAYAKSAPGLGVPREARIAILGRAGDSRLAFMETVAVNRGLRVKAFTVEADALAWLGAPG